MLSKTKLRPTKHKRLARLVSNLANPLIIPPVVLWVLCNYYRWILLTSFRSLWYCRITIPAYRPLSLCYSITAGRVGAPSSQHT